MTSTDRGGAEEDKRLKALRNAVVDASTVSTGLWLTYLLVLLYLVIATFGVTHKDLFLENSVKLPFLNVDLPLTVFFILGPGLFVVLHAYVLIHFALLAGKIGNFRSELKMQVSDADKRTLMRRQFPTSIFVQVLAGPREVRKGLLGDMMWLIAGISLIVSPVALLILFQLQFLPYHNEPITWWHRIMVSTDLVLLWILWPSIAHGALRAPIGKKTTPIENSRPIALGLWRFRTVVAAGRLFTVRTVRLTQFDPPALDKQNRKSWRLWPRPMWTLSTIATAIMVLLVFKTATFPGERLEGGIPSLGLAWLHNWLVAGDFDPGARTARSLWSNVLILPDIDVIDHVKFDNENKLSNLLVTVSLRLRHLEGAILHRAKLRKADLTGVWLQGAQLGGADLREAKFNCGDLYQNEASVRECAQLQGTSFRGAQLQGASLWSAQLQGSDLRGANLDGADLTSAKLLGASLSGAHLQGAFLDAVSLRGADLSDAHLENAWLTAGDLAGASLDRAYLQGAFLDGADLSGASLDRALLEAASFVGITAWRTSALMASGKNAVRADPVADPKQKCLKTNDEGNCILFLAELLATRFNELKQEITASVPDSKFRQDALNRINKLNPAMPSADEELISKDWAHVKTLSLTAPEYMEALARQLSVTGCALEGTPYVLQRFISRFTALAGKGIDISKLAGTFLAENCFGSQGLTQIDMLTLKDVHAHPAGSVTGQ